MIASLVRSAKSRSTSLSVGDWMRLFGFGGVYYPTTTMGSSERDVPPDTFAGYAHGLLYSNPAVFTCIDVRQMIFSEARFKWRQLRNGIAGDLFGDQALLPLEIPEPAKTTSDMLSVALLFSDLGGNWYGYRSSRGIRSLRPDWVEIIFGSRSGTARSPWDLDAEVIGYRYTPGGPSSGRQSVLLAAENVAHFMPLPDPMAPWRGMSWLTPLIREVMGDNAATQHKLKFFEQGATPNMLVKPPPDMGVEEAKEWAAMFDSANSGIDAAYRSMFVGGGADATVVGSNFRQMDFRPLQGLSETRIAAASGIGAVLAQFSEGLQGSALNAGNYGAARRRVADATMRPLWTKMVGALSTIVKAPGGAELWYDDMHIPFLQEDAADDAQIQQLQAVSMRQLVDAGFNPEAVVDAITSGDLRRLAQQHSGMFSVQLQKPGGQQLEDPPQPPRSLEDEFDAILR